MRKTPWILLLISLFVFGCPPADDDDVAGDPGAFIVDGNPAPDGTELGFFYQANLWLEFDRPAEGVTIVLKEGGTELGGTQTQDTPGRVYFFDPSTDLTPSGSYTLEVSWTNHDETVTPPVVIPFQTSDHGTAVANADDMVGRVYNIDLANATFVEPPGVGPIIGSQLDGIAILFSPTAESDFAGGTMHILGALGAEEGGVVSQEDCSETLAFTYGPNGVYDNGGDDTPAAWLNPKMELGPTDITLGIQGIEATIQDLFIGGTFAPTLEDMQGATFAGKIDTRPLAPELDPDGGPGAICDLVWETVNVACEECGGDDPGEFCLSVLAEDIVAAEVPNLDLIPYTCATLIELDLAGTDCDGEAADYDEDGDGVYELCPSYDPGAGDDDDSASDDDDSAR
jgi:hypothetical protein